MESRMIVYAINNKINNKKYIGITTSTITERYPHGIRAHHNPHLRKSVKKYGHNNFEFVILEKNIKNIEMLQELEKKYIEEYDTCNKDKGYNKSLGGYGVRLPHPFSREHCKRISKTKKAIGLNTLTRMTPEAVRIRNAKISKAFRGKNNPMYGMTRDKLKPETLEKLRQASLGKNNPMYGKNIKDYMTKEDYERWRKNVACPGAKNGRARKTVIIYKGERYDFDYAQEGINHFKNKGECITRNWFYNGVNEQHGHLFQFVGYIEDYEKFARSENAG